MALVKETEGGRGGERPEAACARRAARRRRALIHKSQIRQNDGWRWVTCATWVDGVVGASAYALGVAWRPGQRKAQRALEDPYVDVPEHLRQPLWNWIDGSLRMASDFYDAQRIEFLAVDLRTHLPGSSTVRQATYLLGWCNENKTRMLDVVEALLERHGWDSGRGPELEDLLVRANSAYAVSANWDSLEERVAPGVKELVQEAIDASGGSAGDHLANAWNEAYGRRPDPVKAYSEAIKAVEAAMAKHVSPQNGKQTLGTMIRDIAAKPVKWEFVIADGSVSGVETLLGMMRMLWDGQTSRHGGVNPTRDETTDESRAAVHLAAALVQFGVSGALKLA
ncbi:hypothetical protein [Kribbella sp. NPDC006257]|uniref:hypothetical protein n=1 Tax=Kribbella sp. NPDC006257 TaxID=3156738 RepID=UPI0033BC36E2